MLLPPAPYLASKVLFATAVVSYSSCAASKPRVTFAWRLLDGDTVVLSGIQTELAIPSGSMAGGKTYKLSVTVTSGSVSSTDTASLVVSPSPLVALISGGSTRMAAPTTTSLMLDPSTSYDPDVCQAQNALAGRLREFHAWKH